MSVILIMMTVTFTMSITIISMHYLFLVIFVKFLFVVACSRTFDLIADLDAWWYSDLCTVVSEIVQCYSDHVAWQSVVYKWLYFLWLGNCTYFTEYRIGNLQMFTHWPLFSWTWCHQLNYPFILSPVILILSITPGQVKLLVPTGTLSYIWEMVISQEVWSVCLCRHFL